jgi:hypothetical protein
LVTAGGVATTQQGDVIVILHQYAHCPLQKTIHSSGQLEWFFNDVNDISLKVDGGLQRIPTNHGYVFPLQIFQGVRKYSISFNFLWSIFV